MKEKEVLQILPKAYPGIPIGESNDITHRYLRLWTSIENPNNGNKYIITHYVKAFADKGSWAVYHVFSPDEKKRYLLKEFNPQSMRAYREVPNGNLIIDGPESAIKDDLNRCKQEAQMIMDYSNKIECFEAKNTFYMVHEITEYSRYFISDPLDHEMGLDFVLKYFDMVMWNIRLYSENYFYNLPIDFKNIWVADDYTDCQFVDIEGSVVKYNKNKDNPFYEDINIDWQLAWYNYKAALILMYKVLFNKSYEDESRFFKNHVYTWRMRKCYRKDLSKESKKKFKQLFEQTIPFDKVPYLIHPRNIGVFIRELKEIVIKDMERKNKK